MILSALSVEERKIFDLVVRRFLAVMYPNCEYEQTTVTMECAGETFKAEGKQIKSPGYREVLMEQDFEENGGFPSWEEGQKVSGMVLTLTEGKTAPPARFNEGTLLAAMENPVGYLRKKEKEMVKIIQETGGLGTVATRADIIDKLFRSFYIEKRENDIYLTSKARQLLKLVPEDLKKPELTAKWEYQLSEIARGNRRKNSFMGEIRDYAQNITREVITAEGTFRHENITNKICPVCGKKLLAVNGKHGKILVCQDRECGHRENVSRLTNARCPNCHKKMELVGQKGQQKFVCACGHKESMHAFEERRKKEGAGVSKKDVAKYMQKMKKEENKPLNSGLADALAGLKL